MSNNFLKYLVLVIICSIGFFEIGYTQVVIEQKLIYGSDTLFVFNKNGQRGLGKDSNIIEFKYDSIITNRHGCINLAMKQGKWGTIGSNNNIKIPLKYDELLLTFQRDIVIGRKNNKWGVIDEEDQVLIPFKYDKILAVFASDDLFFVEKNGKWGIINEQDKVLFPFEYDSLEKGYNVEVNKKKYETIIVKKNGKFGLLNHKHKTLAPIIYDKITDSYGGGHYVTKNGKKGFINEQGKLLIPCSYEAINYERGVDLFLAKQDNRYGLINRHNKPFLPIAFNKLYLDISFCDTEQQLDAIDIPKSKIIAQKLDSSWHYLNIIDGSSLQEHVNRDTVFKYYPIELFSEELMDKYLQEVHKEEGTNEMILDTLHRQLVDGITAAKNGITIDFPDLHKTLINFRPFYWQIDTIFKIKNYLQSIGFEAKLTGDNFDRRDRRQEVYYMMTFSGCECAVEISLYDTYWKNKYKIVESLKCAVKKERMILAGKSDYCE